MIFHLFKSNKLITQNKILIVLVSSLKWTSVGLSSEVEINFINLALALYNYLYRFSFIPEK